MAREAFRDLTRRAVLVTAAGSAMAGWLGRPGLASAATGGRTGPAPAAPAAPAAPGGAAGADSLLRHPTLRSALEFLDLMMDAYPGYGTLRLPQSHADQVDLHSTAFSYDAALAILAYLRDERAESLDRARLIGDGLVFAQQHDPDFADGRLRQAYNVGPYTLGGVEQPDGFVRPDGTVNIASQYGFVGSGTGELAWAGVALCALAFRVLDARYLTAARRLGDWIHDTCGTEAPLGGYRAGVDRHYQLLRHAGTAHNATVAAHFGLLYALTGDVRWRRRRQTALDFLARMWAPGDGFYYSGSDDGRTIAPLPLTAEAQLLPTLATRRADRTSCLDWLASQLTVTDSEDSPNSALGPDQTVSGITFSDYSVLVDPTVPIEPGRPRPDPDAVWLEGTAQFAGALFDRAAPGDLETALGHLNTLANAQAILGADQTVADRPLPAGTGVIAASSPLAVGTLDSGYYPGRHVATSAWFVLAATRTNPYRWVPAGRSGRGSASTAAAGQQAISAG